MDYKKNVLVNEYIAESGEEQLAIMQTIRDLIFKEAPTAVELFDNEVPEYEVDGESFAKFEKAADHVDFFIDSQETPHLKIRTEKEIPLEQLIDLMAARYVAIQTR